MAVGSAPTPIRVICCDPFESEPMRIWPISTRVKPSALSVKLTST
jgi:hypothetical protein